ncbi:hypothetical protein NLI96_g3363 [Meripilus lineatus]|uniref:Uncharacterized protein n=1 Tax=Meripilus lineatus TaxID=2056292 RepID=A0AAD5V6W7_9APHY|nr:hypothetical protein NLI96_g3363 [Physisporinus lineatus]
MTQKENEGSNPPQAHEGGDGDGDDGAYDGWQAKGPTSTPVAVKASADATKKGPPRLPGGGGGGGSSKSSNDKGGNKAQANSVIINDYYEEEDHKLVDLERDSGLADEQLVSPGSHPEKKLLIGDASVSSSEDQSKRGHQVTRFSAKYRRITKSKGPLFGNNISGGCRGNENFHITSKGLKRRIDFGSLKGKLGSEEQRPWLMTK